MFGCQKRTRTNNAQLPTTNLTTVLTFPRGIVDGAVSVDGAPHVATLPGNGHRLARAARVYIRLLHHQVPRDVPNASLHRLVTG